MLMSMSVPMVALKAQVSSLSSLQMMPAMLFSNSTVTNGKVVLSRFARIASLGLRVAADLVGADLVLVVAAVALAAVLALLAEGLPEVVAALVAADSAVVAEVSEAALVVAAASAALQVLMFQALQPCPTLSPTMLRLALTEVKLSTFAT